jgi:glycosyltransferase involved in cell wall biosynthesis
MTDMAVSTSSLTSKDPLLSVVMAVKNGGVLIADAIQSILGQTFSDFELIIINDGSTDDTVATVGRFNDPRITLISQENQGVSRASNRGLSLARGKYIVRHDHDDLSMPTRFAKQVQFLENSPQCALLGTAAEVWTPNGPTGRFRDLPTRPGVIAFDLIFDSPFVLSSCMFRREVLDTVGLFSTDKARTPMEDYEFVSRVGRHYEMANLPERLVVYREVPNSESSSIRPNQIGASDLVVSRVSLFSAENLAFANEMQNVTDDAINFGAISHWYFKGIVGVPNYPVIRRLVETAATNLNIRFRDPAIAKLATQRLATLDYQYYTYSGQQFKWERIKYILQNRPLSAHFASALKWLNPK